MINNKVLKTSPLKHIFVHLHFLQQVVTVAHKAELLCFNNNKYLSIILELYFV